MVIRIGMLGFGTVGTGVFRILKENGAALAAREGVSFEVKKILVRDTKRSRGIEGIEDLLTSSPEDILGDPEIDMVLELMGGEEPARTLMIAAMTAGKHVVTANKEVVAKHFSQLEHAARENGVRIGYEASVAGGIPVINVMRNSLQGNQIRSVRGIINGTTNYILTRMTDEGRSFDDVLAEAQAMGYAEADPTADVDGFDATYKLAILSSLAFHSRVQVDQIHREGIRDLTAEDIAYGREFGFVLKLLAVAKKQDSGELDVRVHPVFLPKNHPLAAVRDAFNAVLIDGNAVGNLMLYGRGAGDLPTGSAVVSDMISIAKAGDHLTDFGMPELEEEETSMAGDWESEYFIRLSVQDKPGVLSKIAGVFSEHGVSLASVIQKDFEANEVPLIFVTHTAREADIQTAMAALCAEPMVRKINNLIRVER